jgi:hypothetical protein
VIPARVTETSRFERLLGRTREVDPAHARSAASLELAQHRQVAKGSCTLYTTVVDARRVATGPISFNAGDRCIRTPFIAVLFYSSMFIDSCFRCLIIHSTMIWFSGPRVLNREPHGLR